MDEQENKPTTPSNNASGSKLLNNLEAEPRTSYPLSDTPGISALQDDSMQTLIPTKNMPALLSYYFGIAGLIPMLGLPFTMLALIFGKKALKLYAINPTPGAKGHAVTGITLGSIQLVLFLLFIVFLFLS